MQGNRQLFYRGTHLPFSAKLLLLLLSLLIAGPSRASDQPLPSITAADGALPDFLPSKFITSRGLPGMSLGGPTADSAKSPVAQVEKAAGVTGELYTVVAPIFLGGAPDGGNTSFLRLFNDSGRSATFKINVVAFKKDSTTDSGSTLVGTASVIVPNSSSPQYSANQILSTVGWSSIACPVACLEHAYQGVGFYITSNETYTAYQHVIYNPTSQFFENMTLCGDRSYSDARVAGNVINLINIHTSKLPGYPAYITLHNFSAGNRRYGFIFFDASRGREIDPVAIVIKDTLGNSSYTIPMSWFESEAKWTPSATQQHVNVAIVEYGLNGVPVIGEVKATAGLLIYNSALQAYVNMTQTCQLQHRTIAN